MTDPTQRPVIRDLLGLLGAEAHRHGASVKIEHAHGRWGASLVKGQRELLGVQDDGLEPALARLWAAVAGAQLDARSKHRVASILPSSHPGTR